VAGEIIVDMTFLKDQGRIHPTIPEAGAPGKPHYKVEFNLVITVSGRSLRFEAHWLGVPGGRVIESRETCIAAAFQSGTS
jgi:hypothetical protein